MTFVPYFARNKWFAGCLAVVVPVLAVAAPPPEVREGAHGGCDMEFRGPPGPPMGPPGPFFGDRPPPFLTEVNLTEDQQDKVFAILHAVAPALREQAKAERKAREALHDLGRAAQFDAGNASALAQALGKAESQLALLRVRTEHDLCAVLTDEQRAQVAERERGHEAPRHDGPPPPR